MTDPRLVTEIDKLIRTAVMIVNCVEEKHPRGKQALNTRQRASKFCVFFNRMHDEPMLNESDPPWNCGMPWIYAQN